MKLSKAANEYLRDAIYRDSETWEDCAIEYVFGNYDNNAVTRELIAAGAFDILPVGWSKVRVVTRDGWEHASALQAERNRLMGGVPISEYRLERGIPLNKPGLVAVQTRGKWWHTNGHVLCTGEATSTEIPRSSLTPGKLRTDVLKYLENAKQAVTCRPVAYQMFGCYGGVWFSDGQAMNSLYYSHVMRLFPDAEWSVAGFAFFASSKGRTVASVMQFKADANETVSELMAA